MGKLAEFEQTDIARVGIKAMRNIATEWNLTTDEFQRLLGVLPEELSAQGNQIHDEQLERISLLLGIYKAANTLFPSNQRATAYLRHANQRLAGSSAMEIMLQGSMEDLSRVRRFLAAQCV